MQHHQQILELYLKHFAGHKDTLCGIEIGTMCGDFTRQILWNFPDCQIYTMDPWEHRDCAQFEAGEPQDYHNHNREFAEARLGAPEFEGRVVSLAMKSEEAHAWIVGRNPGKLFDFCHVDGDHSEEGIKKDIELYYPMVKKGGIFSMHDVGLVHPLTEIVEAHFGDRLHKGADFTGWVFV